MNYIAKNINTKFLFIMICVFISIGANAQNKYLFNEAHSPLQKEFNNNLLHSENKIFSYFMNNPALLHSMIEDDRYFSLKNPRQQKESKYNIFISSEGAIGENHGDYLPYQGKEFKDLSLQANGYKRDEKATFFGKLNFVMGQRNKMDWNVIQHPELYWPYIVAEGQGGDFTYEKYNLLLAYSFALKKYNLGLSFDYKGDFAVRQNEPRIENITSWLTFKGGISREFKKNRFGLNFSFLKHKQHMNLNHFRSAQFTSFYVEYGFGMFDYIHSPIFNRMKQQQNINEYGLGLTFNSNPAKDLRMNAGLKYKRNIMDVEEDIHKLNLYRAFTNKLNFTYNLLWNNDYWGFSFLTNIDVHNKTGREFLFEKYVSATIDGVDIYDFRKISYQDKYQLLNMNAGVDLKVSYFMGSNHTFSLLLGATQTLRDETYKELDYQIKNASITPKVGIEFKGKLNTFAYELKQCWSKKTSIENKYDVGLYMTKHTEFQHAFTTYAYNSVDAVAYSTQIILSKDYSFGRIGIKGQLLLTKGKRLSDAVYDSNQFNNAEPILDEEIISIQPNRHNINWFKIGIFTEF